jgi:hypothetical protein
MHERVYMSSRVRAAALELLCILLGSSRAFATIAQALRAVVPRCLHSVIAVTSARLQQNLSDTVDATPSGVSSEVCLRVLQGLMLLLSPTQLAPVAAASSSLLLASTERLQLCSAKRGAVTGLESVQVCAVHRGRRFVCGDALRSLLPNTSPPSRTRGDSLSLSSHLRPLAHVRQGVCVCVFVCVAFTCVRPTHRHRLFVVCRRLPLRWPQ